MVPTPSLILRVPYLQIRIGDCVDCVYLDHLYLGHLEDGRGCGHLRTAVLEPHKKLLDAPDELVIVVNDLLKPLDPPLEGRGDVADMPHSKRRHVCEMIIRVSGGESLHPVDRGRLLDDVDMM